MARFEAATSAIGEVAFKKALFQSPLPVPESAKAASSSDISPSMTMIYKVQLEQDTDTNKQNIKRDHQIQRLKELRELATKLLEDDWQYESAEVLTGLQ
ncbi:anaphase-promoting complex subunit 16-like [Plakobranchus ocellatus]|uniref:Anaphase-promoting complex subunit 16-like n=1 Tax=Plakobranchus ocellatus TaxID=259542 RepID=A0AAV4D3G6_9GAST|nr:anaphase-promoting complex subunit 16-like [Plakobranchus ocellatus]